MRFWYSDPHFGHRNIIDYVPSRQNLPGVRQLMGDFSVLAMNEALVERWNETVTDDDEVVIVGDIAMGRIADSLQYVKRLNGRKLHVAGNHDRWWGTMPDANGDFQSDKQRRAWERWSAAYEAVGLELVSDGWYDIQVGDHLVRVCHFPYVGDSHDEDRFVDHRPPDDGLILVHGHVHDEWQTRGRMINVACDVHDYRPISDLRLLEMIDHIEHVDAQIEDATWK